MYKKQAGLIAYLFFTILFIYSCASKVDPGPCLEFPERDLTPPDIGLSIDYFSNSQKLTKNYTAESRADTLHADKNQPVLIHCSGKDGEGIKSIHLSVVVKRLVMGVEQKHDYEIMPVVGNCPVKSLEDRFTLEGNQIKGTAEVTLKAANWMDLRTGSPTFVVVLE